ncbi:MAG: hypothetical protein R2788_17095 [Saprospiraceae bacterium]
MKLMKNLFLILFFSIVAFSTTNAQNSKTQPTPEDYERLIRATENMEFREYAIKSLKLTSQQIEDFDPLYRSYMREKSSLAQRKFDLLDEYVEEMAEDDSAKNEENDTENYIEKFWKVEIAEMELKKDYFDKMADKISVDNAFGFFMLEQNAQNEVQKQIIERRYIPIYIEVEKPNTSTGSINKNMPDEKDIMKQPIDKKYKAAIEAFSNWVESGSGKVGLDHQYTHDGLYSLVGATSALSEASQVNYKGLAQKKEQILNLADKLQENKYSDKHADYAREAFTMAASMLKTVQQKSDFSASNYAVSQVEVAAKKIDPDKLMTPQAEHIYGFFQKAQMAINSMSNSFSWAGN